MSDGRVVLGLGLLGAAGYGLWQALRGKSFGRSAAIASATSFVNDFVAIQRQAGFIINVLGVEDVREQWGPPSSMPFTDWNSIDAALAGRAPDLIYVQIGIAYTPPGAGGGENIITVWERANGNLLTVFQTNVDLASWFQPLGP